MAADRQQRPYAAVLVSDMHLDAATPRTAQAFADFLVRQAPRTESLYILGDLFEAWPGDDAIDEPFNAGIIAILKRVSDAGVKVFWMAGNRDFLIGPAFAAAAQLTILPDPSVVTIAERQIILAHGDAQCTDDRAYQAFRQQVRDPSWQAAFLARPLAERLQLIAGMREGSRAAQLTKSNAIMDVNPDAIEQLIDDADTPCMIHGHTHRPMVHHSRAVRGRGWTRYVLTDWDCEGRKPRGGGLAVATDGHIMQLRLRRE